MNSESQTDYHRENSRFGESNQAQADTAWMRSALAEAQAAEKCNEVPIGAVIVQNGRIIGQSGNATEASEDPTAHAEILAIRQAVRATKTRWLHDATLYVTLEPCAMCAGAVVLARMRRLVFGALDPKGGACMSLRNIVQDLRLNHRCQVTSGVLAEECGSILTRFFRVRRNQA
jgi:tRNA(adenine34) deaminase